LPDGGFTVTRVGHRVLLDPAEIEAFAKTRVPPPAGYVRLRSLRQPLGIRHDKLSELARMGYVPTAVRARVYGQGPSSVNGTWWIAPEAARRLVRDRRAGRRMPWHGQPHADQPQEDVGPPGHRDAPSRLPGLPRDLGRRRSAREPSRTSRSATRRWPTAPSATSDTRSRQV
jgi:hypothetical protein